MYVDTSRIEPGRLGALKEDLKDLASFVEANVPRAIAYHTYISDDEKQMTVVQVHPDSRSLEHHMTVAAKEFPKFKDHLRLERIEVYGEVSKKVLEMLHQKAHLLGTGTVTVHGPHAGFERYLSSEARM